MPTAAERQALVFLAALALIGGGARVLSARRFEADVRHGVNDAGPPRNGEDALRHQIDAIDSARAAGGGRNRVKRTTKSSRGRRTVTTPAESPPASRSRVEPPEPTLSRGGRRSPPEPIAVNDATAEELERLPRVGPALARRIVAYRAEHGRLTSVDDLRHVRGIGVTTAALLAPLVTFSSGYRPFRSEIRPAGRDSAPTTQ